MRPACTSIDESGGPAGAPSAAAAGGAGPAAGRRGARLAAAAAGSERGWLVRALAPARSLGGRALAGFPEVLNLWVLWM